MSAKIGRKLQTAPKTESLKNSHHLVSIVDLLNRAEKENVPLAQVASKEYLKSSKPYVVVLLAIHALIDISRVTEREESSFLEMSTNMEFAETERLWYKEAVFYEVYVRAFCDSNGRGHGDIAGLTSKLDYLHYLGVDCLWLLPIYPSPLKDDGYDVADYCNIHPDYGTLQDFKTLVAAVHERSMRIIVDFVPNHSSDQCEWFKQSRSSRDNPYRDWYVWSDDPNKYQEARIIFIDVEQSNWTWDPVAGQYYWHRFFSSQPDLNYENPKVRAAMLDVMKFWLDIGVDGFRVDAVPFLFEQDGTTCESLPQTHDFLREMRAFVERVSPDAIILCEACQPPQDVRKYFGENGDEFHMGFHFPLMPRIFLSIKSEDSSSLKQIMSETPEIPEKCQWVTFLRNHDELTLEMVTPEERQYMWREYAPEPRMKLNLGIRRRLAPLMDNDSRRIELAYSMLFTMPGSPILDYGDEIGMGDNIWLDDRNGVRTPMQWDPTSPTAGFSPSTKIYAPVVDSKLFGKQRVNVKDALSDPSSIFHVVRQMISTRRKHAAFGFGTFMWIDQPNKSVAVYLRDAGFDKILVVANLSNKKQEVQVPVVASLFPYGLPPFLIDVLTQVRYFTSSDTGTNVSCIINSEPYQFLWLSTKAIYNRDEDYQVEDK